MDGAVEYCLTPTSSGDSPALWDCFLEEIILQMMAAPTKRRITMATLWMITFWVVAEELLDLEERCLDLVERFRLGMVIPFS
jgi:hypothetical protein